MKKTLQGWSWPFTSRPIVVDVVVGVDVEVVVDVVAAEHQHPLE